MSRDSEIRKKVDDWYESLVDELAQNPNMDLEEREEKMRQLQQVNALRVDSKASAEDKAEKAVRLAVDILGIVLPVAVSSMWMKRGLEFEKTNTYTTRTMSWIESITRIFKKR